MESHARTGVPDIFVEQGRYPWFGYSQPHLQRPNIGVQGVQGVQGLLRLSQDMAGGKKSHQLEIPNLIQFQFIASSPPSIVHNNNVRLLVFCRLSHIPKIEPEDDDDINAGKSKTVVTMRRGTGKVATGGKSIPSNQMQRPKAQGQCDTVRAITHIPRTENQASPSSTRE